MYIDEFIEKYLPKEIESLGKRGYLEVFQSIEAGNFYNWWCIMYRGEDNMPIESVYEKNSKVYLCSFFETKEQCVFDMFNRLIEGKIIDLKNK